MTEQVTEARIQLAPRVQAVRPSPSAAVSARARALRAQGRDIIMLSAGDPDFPTPDHIQDAAVRAMRAGETKYTNADGTPALKSAVRDKFRRENGLDFQPDQVIVGAGAKAVIFNALMATLAEGEEVIVPTPYWVSYPDMVTLSGGRPVTVDGDPAHGFKVRPETVEAAIGPRTRWLILNSPGNPSGAFYGREELSGLAAMLRRHPQVLVLSDEVYEHVVFEDTHVAFAAACPDLADRTLTVNSVSKAYAMTGWRIGYAGGPARIVRAMATVQSQSASNPCSISQAAAVEALTGPQGLLAQRRDILRQRRDLMVAGLRQCPGLEVHTPPGAIYAYACCTPLIGRRTTDGRRIDSDTDLALYLLDCAGVAVVQGAAYGMSPYLRLDFSVDEPLIEEACRRIQSACQSLA